MIDDYTEFWMSNTDPGPYVNSGTWEAICYVNHGARVALGTSPTTPADGSAADPYFNNQCDSGRYDIASG